MRKWRPASACAIATRAVKLGKISPLGNYFLFKTGTLHSNNVLNMDNDGIDNGLEIYTGDDCTSGGNFMHSRT